MDRRNFIKNSSKTGIALMALSLIPLKAAQKYKSLSSLKKDPDKLFNLPDFLEYKIVARNGEVMSDGLQTPPRPDGMACFQNNDGTITLIKNHEIGSRRLPSSYDSNLPKSISYDTNFAGVPYTGGTTNLVLDPKSLKRIDHYRSLAGTINNCAGGRTSWGSWISCEETRMDDHGYAFEVYANKRPNSVRRLDYMGRFNREAVSIYEPTGIVYQTEDDSSGLFYRFLPSDPKDLAKPGKLQALKIKSQIDPRNPKNNIKTGSKFEVEWVDIDDFHAKKTTTKYQGSIQGASPFNGSEGIITDKKSVFFTCKDGGYKEHGQIFRYYPSKYEGTTKEVEQPGILELFYESKNKDEYWGGDNIVIAPWGDLIICEDNGSRGCKLLGINNHGSIYVIGQVEDSSSEIAGVCFSPDGKNMFLNIQDEGRTIAIFGDWKKIQTLY